MRYSFLSIAILCFSSHIVQAKTVDVVDTITVNPTTIANYDNVDINIDWTAKDSIEVGDTFTVTLPTKSEQLMHKHRCCQQVGVMLVIAR